MLYIFIGSKNDKLFLNAGIKYLEKNNVLYKIIITSVHRQPITAHHLILKTLKNKNIKIIIGGAATATGLPGVIAGYIYQKKLDIKVLSLRFTKKPWPRFLAFMEKFLFRLSGMPSGPELKYTGYNEYGFLKACKIAKEIIEK